MGSRSSRMKILQLVHNVGYGGTERYTVSVTEELRRRGHDCVIASPVPSQLQVDTEEKWVALLTDFEPDILQIQHLHGFNHEWLKYCDANIVMKCDDAYLTCARYHLMHHTLLGGREACSRPDPLSCGTCAKSRGAQLASTSPYYHAMNRSRDLIGLVDEFVFASDWLRRHTMSYVPEIEDKSMVIHTGIEPFDRPRKRIGFFGAFCDRKGAALFLEMMSYLRETQPGKYLFVVAGPLFAPYGNDLNVQANEHKDVKYLGVYEPSQRTKAFSEIDVLVFPSLAENYSFLVREARYAGVPVIASDVGAIREIGIEPIALYTPYAFADAIEDLFPTVAMRTIKDEVDDYEALYAKLLA